ncbi:protein kinase [Acetobacter malorum]|uniref:Protein kinase n=1 Tax=Acetobacter malorum TaxID=178901 RepID=A0A177GC74_9PROT|nr:protein kinase [Acetobacter malorum]
MEHIFSNRYSCKISPMQGGMATVYQCRDLILERDVAIKIMSRGMEARRFQDEIAGLTKIRSKHVVQIYDVIIEDGQIGIVQEFINGLDLFDPRFNPKTTDEILRILWQIASGIADIHHMGLIHRDIKPNNMKIDHEGILKIFDFGLSRPDGPRAETVGFVGTIGFAAPEQYNGIGQFTNAVDVYAFGATALYLLSGKILSVTEQNDINSKLENYFKNLNFIIPNEVIEIIKRCFAIQAQDRPNINEVRDLLAKFLLFDRHKALVVMGSKVQYLDCMNKKINLRYQEISSVSIEYNSLDFIVSSVSGDFYVNNGRVFPGFILPGACVLTFGAPELRHKRAYVTFDLSHPEVVV